MTLKQLEYVVKVAECGTVSGAAKALFVAQPSLSAAIQELESEMHLTLFHRTNKGVIVTKEGEVFLSYARQILEQTALLESRYKGDPVRKQAFCVSTQHYSFAVNAFVDLIRERGGDRYDFSLRETQTYEIIEDVAQRKSEIGLLYLNDFNRTALQKLSHFLCFLGFYIVQNMRIRYGSIIICMSHDFLNSSRCHSFFKTPCSKSMT